MRTVYEINQLCKMNTSNPTPCKYNMEVAINIVPVRKNKKFENFVLGINDYPQCCEDFGTDCTLEHFEVEKFVESIEVGADVSRSSYELHFLPEVLESGLIDVKVDK